MQTLLREQMHRRAARVLPEVVMTSGFLLPAESPDTWLPSLMPVRRPLRGTVVFKLAAATAAALCAAPGQLLDRACKARAGLSRHAVPITYQRWQRALWPGPGIIEAIACIGTANAAFDTGVYFTVSMDRRVMLLLMPATSMVVYRWCDRAVENLFQPSRLTPGTNHNDNPASNEPMPKAASTSLG